MGGKLTPFIILKLLLDQGEDSSYAVRMLIAHVLGTRVRKAEALPLLREMTNDSNQMVSDQAKRYVDLLSARP